jgi:hypothetical protein
MSDMPSTWTYSQVCDAERREQALQEAYADGRADERAQWEPLVKELTNLLTAIRWLQINEADARAALAKATGEEA